MIKPMRTINGIAWLLGGVLLAVSGFFVAADTASTERVLWEKQPIPVMLTVDQERLIHFPSDVRYWLPDSLKTRLNILAANGVLYLEARQPIDTVRLRVQALDSQQLYLLDITATESGDYPDTLIVMQENAVLNDAKQSDPIPQRQDWRIRLTRFAAQSLYAPERLMPADNNIQRISIDTTTPVSLIRGGGIEAIPVAAWRGGGLTVTAVRLRNLSQQTVVMGTRPHPTPTLRSQDERLLDLSRDIRGQWLTASVQHGTLTATGSDTDRTCLYLVSRHSFEGSL